MTAQHCTEAVARRLAKALKQARLGCNLGNHQLVLEAKHISCSMIL